MQQREIIAFENLLNFADEIELRPGTYSYTFECQLPEELPTSVEGERGHIQYNARVVMDRPLFRDKEFDTVFTVVKPLNLNNFESLCVSKPRKIVSETKSAPYSKKISSF